MNGLAASGASRPPTAAGAPAAPAAATPSGTAATAAAAAAAAAAAPAAAALAETQAYAQHPQTAPHGFSRGPAGFTASSAAAAAAAAFHAAAASMPGGTSPAAAMAAAALAAAAGRPLPAGGLGVPAAAAAAAAGAAAVPADPGGSAAPAAAVTPGCVSAAAESPPAAALAAAKASPAGRGGRGGGRGGRRGRGAAASAAVDAGGGRRGAGPVSPSGASPAGGPSGDRPQRARRAPRLFEVEAPADDKLLKVAIGRSLLETRRVEMDYSSLPAVPEVRFPSWDSFRANPIAVFEGLRAIGREFGAVKVVPPPDWDPPFALDALKNDQALFHVRSQEVHSLMTGKPFQHPEAPVHASELRSQDRELTRQVFGCYNPSVDTVEAVYWKSVESGTPQLTVHYAADLKTNELGSGFPVAAAAAAAPDAAAAASSSSSSSCGSSTEASLGGSPQERQHHAASQPAADGLCKPAQQQQLQQELDYCMHPWNLAGLARVEGSLLRHYHRDVPGVTSPWLYIWYVVPPSRAPSVERTLQSYLADRDPQYVLHSLTVQLPPSLFVENGIPVYRIEQHPKEFVMLWPRTYHAGFNAGFNCNEACNFAPPLWLQWGQKALRSYRYMRSTCIPYQQLVLRAAVQGIGGFAPRQQLELCRAVARLLLEEYGVRLAAWEQQLALAPMQVAAGQLNKVEALSPNVEGWRRDLRRLLSAFGNLLVPLPLGAEEEGSRCSRAELVARIADVVSLPVKDCSNCKACCALTCVSCCHRDDYVCFDCVSSLSCSCGQRVVLSRVPLPTLRLLYEHCLDSLMMHAKQQAADKLPQQQQQQQQQQEGELQQQLAGTTGSVKSEDASSTVSLSSDVPASATAAAAAAATAAAEVAAVVGGLDVRCPSMGVTGLAPRKRGRPRLHSRPNGDAKRRAADGAAVAAVAAAAATSAKPLLQEIGEDALLQSVPAYVELLSLERKCFRGVDYYAAPFIDVDGEPEPEPPSPPAAAAACHAAAAAIAEHPLQQQHQQQQQQQHVQSVSLADAPHPSAPSHPALLQQLGLQGFAAAAALQQRSLQQTSEAQQQELKQQQELLQIQLLLGEQRMLDAPAEQQLAALQQQHEQQQLQQHQLQLQHRQLQQQQLRLQQQLQQHQQQEASLPPMQGGGLALHAHQALLTSPQAGSPLCSLTQQQQQQQQQGVDGRPHSPSPSPHRPPEDGSSSSGHLRLKALQQQQQQGLVEGESSEKKKEPLAVDCGEWAPLELGSQVDLSVGRLSCCSVPAPEEAPPATGRRGRRVIPYKTLAAEPVVEKSRELAVRGYVQQLSWRYFIRTLKEEAEDDDEQILPMFKKAARAPEP
ncbi:hypothetical protein Efla_005315 [Eimeria flavescens]